MIKAGEIISEIPEINCKKTKETIVEFIKSKVSESKTDGIVVGLSGGIDSTLIAYLACEAVGKDNVFGIVMPSATTPAEDTVHGIEIAQRLGIEYREIAIDSILNEYLCLTKLEEDNLAIGNLKARIRMSIIYYYANAKNYLVSGTGNRSEILIGYFTKHGDGACDMEPIGDLYKSEVYKLSEYLNIQEEIIKKPPRAGLWENQSDEEEIGMSYDLLDEILYLFTEKDMKNTQIAERLDISVDDVNMIINKIIRSEHKSKVHIEKKWQKKWADAKIFESNPDEREKLYLTVAFPYPSGAMHIGHGRTYTVPDVYARFKRMEGYNVLFPMAWHVTGAPVIGIADRIQRKDPWTLDLYHRVHGVPKETLPKLEDPEYIVKYFSTEYHEVMDEMGYSIDWRREFRTIDPTYKKFIEWQITTLYEKGLIQKGEHPVKYCPNCDNPVGDHDLLEGEGVGVNELTLLKFPIEDKILVTATLRPETIVGATNIWLNPDVEYVLVNAEGEKWVITKEAHYNLSNQIKDLDIISEIDPNELIGKMAKNPFTGDELPIFPASFVSASYGSGVVFSEPADAPADYIALQDLKKNEEMIAKYNLGGIIENVEPIPVCTLKGYGEIPAADIIERLGITDQNDEKLHEATNELYKQQHSKGTIIESIPDFGGMKVRFAREELKEKLIAENMATIMYDFAERPVVCRCGNNCVVKIMDDQWFMKYGNEEWTEKTLEVLEGETIIPKEIKNNFDYYINWLDDWACSRKVGLGTRLPWDNQWLIEPLTDSTIYMSYYAIAKYVKDMNPDDLTPAFFDKVLLNKDSGEITVPQEKVQEIQDEFNYWYPLDWRLSAKDLVGNHLSFLMFAHSAIYPKEKWPQGTVVFGMGLLEGNKMSSSKGNVILLKDAIRDYTADVVRLFLMASAEPWQDFDWREKEVLGTKRRLEWFREFGTDPYH